MTTDSTAARPSGPVVYLGHGAAGNAASMQPHVDGLRRRGIAATAVQLPKRKAEEVIDIYREQVTVGDPIVIGGHSFGGRVASLLAARDHEINGRPLGGLVLLSYPLHRPGGGDSCVRPGRGSDARPGSSRGPGYEIGPRSAHFESIECPVLLLSGEADPFARIDLLREAVKAIPNAELITWPKLGHGLAPVLDEALDHVARFVRGLT